MVEQLINFISLETICLQAEQKFLEYSRVNYKKTIGHDATHDVQKYILDLYPPTQSESFAVIINLNGVVHISLIVVMIALQKSQSKDM